MIRLNGSQITPTLFPDQTSQIWNIDLDVLSKRVKDNTFEIDWRFSHEGELFHLAQLVMLLKEIKPGYRIHLHMDYLPYSRQDKIITNSTTFALTTFAIILNNLHIDKITAIDSHSDRTKFLINNFINIFPSKYVATVCKEVNPDVLCVPDKGALTRYVRDLAFLGRPYIWGEKDRNQVTGHISNIKLNGNVQDKTVLIVDDICDGGMTFILLAKELLTNGAKSVSLYTTHGIYSKGLKPLREAKIDRIFNMYGEVGELQDNITIKEIK